MWPASARRRRSDAPVSFSAVNPSQLVGIACGNLLATGRTMRPIASCLLIASLLFLGGADLIEKSELHCEEAVHHLSDCCHNAIADRYSCTAGRGCDDTRPDLDDPLATEIRGESCDRLVASGACENPPK